MTSTALDATDTAPRRPNLPKAVAAQLAAGEYDRLLDMLRELTPQEWTRPTECPGWDVRAMAGHVVGMARMAAGLRETLRQDKAARRRGGVYIDALTALQVQEQAALTPAALVDRFEETAPRAARARRRMPALLRRKPMPLPQQVGDRLERWTNGYLVDVILTRDTWMHRIDICRATGRAPLLTADHDGWIVRDVVEEWAERHGRPYELELTGPAGGSHHCGSGGHPLSLDAVEFCRVLSGRSSDAATPDDLFGTYVPF
jgi:uncharacterized protein (TIGR03083 family)